MPPDPLPGDETTALRRQLILAQVQIMELDDAREAAAAELARTEARLRELQSLADGALKDLQDSRLAQSGREAHLADLQAQASALSAQLHQAETARIAGADQLAQQVKAAAELQHRLQAIEARFASLRASRSWRWTAPLRTVERWLRPGSKP